MSFKSIYGLDRARNHEPALELGAYLYAISSIGRHAVEIDQDAAAKLRLGLGSLHQELESDGRPAAVEASQSTLDGLLGTWRDATLARHTQQEGDVREILAVLENAAKSLTQQGEQQNSRLKEFTKKLHAASRLHDLSEVRRLLTEHARELQSVTLSMWQESKRSASHLEEQLAQFQERLDRAERLASTDELTGALNRREGEARLAAKIAKGHRFCLMILDLDRFKAINDQHGHSAGDQVLRIFARKLLGLAPRGDVVCRWGGDEFVVLTDMPLAAADESAAKMQTEVSGRYTVIIAGREVSLQVGVSIGVAEYSDADGAEQLFARADEDLYRQKKPATRLA